MNNYYSITEVCNFGYFTNFNQLGRKKNFAVSTKQRSDTETPKKLEKHTRLPFHESSVKIFFWNKVVSKK